MVSKMISFHPGMMILVDFQMGWNHQQSTVIDEKWNWLGDHRPKGTSCPAESESGISWLTWPAFCAIPGTTRGHPAIALNELEGERPRSWCTEPRWKGNPPGAAERWENMGECHQNLIILSHYDHIILNSPVRHSRLSAIDPVRSTNHSQINFCWFRFVWKSYPKTCPKLAQNLPKSESLSWFSRLKQPWLGGIPQKPGW